METEFKYRAFISYSHSDEEWAKWLHRALETYRVPKHLVGRETEFGPVPARIAPVFRDRDELATATNLGETLTRALQQSAFQIVICSPKAARSRWVNEEILAFKRLGREHRIFALVVDGEPGGSSRPETAEIECFPNALIYRMGADGELTERTQRADRGGWPAGQGQQARRQAEARRGNAVGRARRAEAARRPPAPRPHDVAGERVGRRHGHHLDAGDGGLVRPQRGGTAACARGGGGRDRATDHAIHGGPVQGVGSERSARQLDHRARDSRQGRGAHRQGAGGSARDPGDADGHDGHGLHQPRPLRAGGAARPAGVREAAKALGCRACRGGEQPQSPRRGADAQVGLRGGGAQAAQCTRHPHAVVRRLESRGRGHVEPARTDAVRRG